MILHLLIRKLNINLQTIKLGSNKIKSAGAIKIARTLHNTVILTRFNLYNSNISEEAADEIAAVLSQSKIAGT